MNHFLPWKIVHVALREPLPDLDAETEWGGLFLVFWCDNLPVGQMWISGSLLPLTSAQLAASVATTIAAAVGHRLLHTAFPRFLLPRRDAPTAMPDLACLLALEHPLESCARLSMQATSAPTDADGPSVSVVICTSNRPEALRRCLDSIHDLVPPPHDVTVVDTDPSSGSTEIVTAAFPGVRYVPACHHGLSAARNIGIRSCNGAVIAFAADDVTVHPGWIGVWQRVFDDPEIIAATGLVLPAELATPAQYAHQNGELWDFRAAEFGRTFFRSWRRIGVPTWWLGTGANMAFRRQAFERVGSFDERLGAGAAGSSEDCELWYRLLEAGLMCRYEPAAVAFHAHPTDWKGLSAQTFTQMRGHVAALLFQFDRYRHRGNVNRALLVLPYRVLTLAVQALKRTVLTQDAGGGQALPPLWPQVRGVLAGYGYYLRHRRLRAAAEIDDARPTDYSPDSPGATAPV